MMEEFEKIHGDEIQYDHGLLLKQNLPELMERIKYECQRSSKIFIKMSMIVYEFALISNDSEAFQ